MRIGIDARFFGPKQKGLGRYVQKLIENLPESDDFEFSVFLGKENFDNFQPPLKNFKKALANWRWYTFAEQVFLPSKIWQEKIDLMHFPHFNVSLFCPTKFVVTIHDLVLKKFPTRRATTLNPAIYKIKEFGYKIVLNCAIKKSQKIIVPSNFTKNEILKYFKVDPEKIKVIKEGVPEISQNHIGSSFQDRETMTEKVLKKYKIVKPYILYVGNAYPHKNLEGLIMAFKKVIEDSKLDYRLVLVGEIDYFYKRLISNFQFPASNSSVVFTDFVSDEELLELYKNATLYVSPAHCEGFGLPALEAMSCGLPVVASNGGSQPEILEEAALYFNSKNIEEMAEKIKLLLKDENLRKNLIEKGYQQVKKYSWQKMAKETLEIYRQILIH